MTYFRSNNDLPSYDISADGQRFLMVKPEGRASVSQLNFVQNWLDELQRLVPSP